MIGLPTRHARSAFACGFGETAFARFAWNSRYGLAEPKPAKDGGGRRTRTFEVIRRLIYSQLPLPLGTLPRSMALDPAACAGIGLRHGNVKTAKPDDGDGGRPRFMGEGAWQSQPRDLANSAPGGLEIARIRDP